MGKSRGIRGECLAVTQCSVANGWALKTALNTGLDMVLLCEAGSVAMRCMQCVGDHSGIVG